VASSFKVEILHTTFRPTFQRTHTILGFTEIAKFYIDETAVTPKSTVEEYQRPNRPEKEDTMDRYVCTICGYVYDPAQGDPDSGVAPGTKFEDLPDDWECPVCGASKADFEKEE